MLLAAAWLCHACATASPAVSACLKWNRNPLAAQVAASKTVPLEVKEGVKHHEGKPPCEHGGAAGRCGQDTLAQQAVQQASSSGGWAWLEGQATAGMVEGETEAGVAEERLRRRGNARGGPAGGVTGGQGKCTVQEVSGRTGHGQSGQSNLGQARQSR